MENAEKGGFDCGPVMFRRVCLACCPTLLCTGAALRAPGPTIQERVGPPDGQAALK